MVDLTRWLRPAVARLERARVERLTAMIPTVEDERELVHFLCARGGELLFGGGDPERVHDGTAMASVALECAVGRTLDSGAATDPHLVRFAMELAGAGANDRMRGDALTQLGTVLATLAHDQRADLVGVQNLGRCVEWCQQGGRSPWRAVQALEILLACSPDPALQVAGALLARRAADEWLVRALVVDRLAARGIGLELLRTHARVRDPSEMVRQRLAAALVRFVAAREVTATEVSAFFLNDPSPRVRAWLARASCQSLATASENLRRVIVDGLEDAHPLVRAVTRETLRTVALDALAHEQPPPNKLSQLLVSLQRRRSAHPTEAAALADVVEVLSIWSMPGAAERARQVRAAVAGCGPGGTVEIDGPAEHLGRVLALLAQDDLGLYAQTTRGGRLRIQRGTRAHVRPWRLLHELRHPRPDKRADIAHACGPMAPGTIRAHAARVSTSGATRVPGEPVRFGADWGRHLPLLEDVLAGDSTVFSSRGLTTIQLPAKLWDRLRTRARLHWRYQRLCALRGQSLAATDAQEKREYARVLEELGVCMRFAPYSALAAGGFIELGDAPARAHFLPPMALAAAPVMDADGTADLIARVLAPVGNDIGQLALFAAVAGSALVAFSATAAWRTEQHRRQIPMTVGGWGTRGKSSVERLKAAMFVGLGYEVLCKTTGSVPSILAGTPWGENVELPLYRPGGRATIWEQRDVLAVAAARGVQVLTWECMAIRPQYAEILQSEWMGDELVTLTNTHADHEEHQGPGALDVTESLTRIARGARTLVTSEQDMLPEVLARARAHGAEAVPVGAFEAELLAEDFMRAFPYEEHRNNVALVRQVAMTLGFDPDLAAWEAARHVTPDIGVLSRTSPVTIGAHRVTLVNAMAANDPITATDTLARIDSPAGEARIIVSNTRRDRPVRTELFARLLARIDACTRVVTGTDVRVTTRIFDQEARTVADELGRDARDRADGLTRVLARMGIDDPGAGAVVSTMSRAVDNLQTLFPGVVASVDTDRVSELAHALLEAPCAAGLAGAREHCAGHPATRELLELVPEPMRASVERAWLQALVPRVAARNLPEEGWREALRTLTHALFNWTLVPAPADVDAVVAAALRHAPAGDVALIAVQNIGGVGRALLSGFSAPRPGSLLGSAALCAHLRAAEASRAGDRQRWQDAAAVVARRLETTGGTLARALAGIQTQLQSAWSAAAAPVRRFRARRILMRFARRQLSAEAARRELAALVARERV